VVNVAVYKIRWSLRHDNHHPPPKKGSLCLAIVNDGGLKNRYCNNFMHINLI